MGGRFLFLPMGDVYMGVLKNGVDPMNSKLSEKNLLEEKSQNHPTFQKRNVERTEKMMVDYPERARNPRG